MIGKHKKCQKKSIFFFLFLTISFMHGCTTIKARVTSEPPGARILWGPTKTGLEWHGEVTPFEESHDVFLAQWMAGCVQVKKDGYEDSEVVCRPQEQRNRYVHFVLKPKVRPVMRRISSDPPGANIFWGFNEGEMSPITHVPDSLKTSFCGRTPDDITPRQLRISADIREIPPCYQVKKEGYKDSEVKCTHWGDKEDHDFHFVLQPLPPLIKIVDVFLCDEKNPNLHVYSVRWGQQLLMVIRYTLSNVPEGEKVHLTKYYRFSHDQRIIYNISFDDRKSTGTHEATLLMTIPKVMDSGQYALHGIVRTDDQEAEKKFVFTVEE